jgi:ATP-binding cassette subfamily B protein
MASIITIIIPIILRYITNEVVFLDRNIAFQKILVLSVVILFLLTILYGCNYYILYYGHIMGAKIENDMRNEIFIAYQKFSYKFYDNRKVGELISRITTDLFNITDLLHRFPEQILILITRFSGVLIVFCTINWRLAIIAAVLVPTTCFHISRFMPKLSHSFKKLFSVQAEINSQIEDSLSGIRVVKSFANESLEIKKFKNANENFVGSKKEALKITGWGFAGMFTLVSLYSPLIVITGAVLILNDILPLADLMTFILYEFILIEPLFSCLGLCENMGQSIAGYNRFIEILETKSEITDKPDALEFESFSGAISFQNVTFKYEATGKNILKNFNLNIKSGEYIALVGSSGVGKSTVCSLIPRFYDVLEGKITIDGIDIKDIQIKSLRKNIGIVQQELYLFSGTIMENIKYGKPEATRDEVIKAAKHAYAHDFIMNFPDGYDTYVGSKGLKLSGGQKQRLSIARVFLKNPPILIFDEATSSLDNESERCIKESLENLTKNRTTIVIAHRLSTIKNAQKILVLSDGEIAEEGTHDELLLKNGVYAEFYKLL